MLKTEFNTWKDRRFTQDTGNIEICLNDNGTINMDKSEKRFWKSNSFVSETDDIGLLLNDNYLAFENIKNIVKSVDKYNKSQHKVDFGENSQIINRYCEITFSSQIRSALSDLYFERQRTQSPRSPSYSPTSPNYSPNSPHYSPTQ
jgi:hypothetical protein